MLSIINMFRIVNFLFQCKKIRHLFKFRIELLKINPPSVFALWKRLIEAVLWI